MSSHHQQSVNDNDLVGQVNEIAKRLKNFTLSFERKHEEVGKIERFLNYHSRSLALSSLLASWNAKISRFCLPSDYQSVIQRASATDEDCIVLVGKCPIGHKEIQRLAPGNWLNDQIVDGYLWLIGERSLGKIHAFSCFLWSKVQQADLAALRRYCFRWKVQIWEKEMLLFPISISNVHWSLCLVNVPGRRITYYDSLRKAKCPIPRLFENVVAFMQAEESSMEEGKEHEIDASSEQEWKFSLGPSTLPQQQNGNDCGVFVCLFAEYLSRGKAFDFGQEQMTFFRQRITYELLTGKLLN